MKILLGDIKLVKLYSSLLTLHECEIPYTDRFKYIEEVIVELDTMLKLNKHGNLQGILVDKNDFLGISVLQIINKGHILINFSMDLSLIYFDIVSYNSYDKDKLIEYLSRCFQAKQVTIYSRNK
jgi:S-adenosylmethionine/arginine decarboxylase-like enzyme